MVRIHVNAFFTQVKNYRGLGAFQWILSMVYGGSQKLLPHLLLSLTDRLGFLTSEENISFRNFKFELHVVACLEYMTQGMNFVLFKLSFQAIVFIQQNAEKHSLQHK